MALAPRVSSAVRWSQLFHRVRCFSRFVDESESTLSELIGGGAGQSTKHLGSVLRHRQRAGALAVNGVKGAKVCAASGNLPHESRASSAVSVTPLVFTRSATCAPWAPPLAS
jgi:hypothetical protein